MIDIENTLLHSEFQQCTDCKEYFCMTLKDNYENKKRCLECTGIRIPINEYLDIIKSLTDTAKYIISTPAKKLDIEFVKECSFVNEKVKKDLLVYLKKRKRRK